MNATGTDRAPLKKRRGEGKGGGFFLVDRGHWEKLWQISTANRLNLITAFLVLSAGTGADHRLTKWSAKACEERAGMGKPRAKIAIDELIAGGLAERTETATVTFPQYRLAQQSGAEEPIFLPVALVTGLSAETPILRRVREIGDPFVLRMLVDLYGLVQIDRTHGIAPANLTQFDNEPGSTRKIAERGANAVWALHLGRYQTAKGNWTSTHWAKGAENAGWAPFWDRLAKLKSIGALLTETWVFNGEATDAEPLFPVASREDDRSAEFDSDVRVLTEVATDAAEGLIGERSYLIEQNSDRDLVVLPTHHQAPFIRGVFKLRVEADTPGRRLAYARRKQAIEQYTNSCVAVAVEAKQGTFTRPIQLPA